MRIRPGVALAAMAVGLASGLLTIALGVWLARWVWSLDLTYQVLLGVLLMGAGAWTWFIASDAKALLVEIDKQNDR